jgi:hypothetical protein
MSVMIRFYSKLPARQREKFEVAAPRAIAADFYLDSRHFVAPRRQEEPLASAHLARAASVADGIRTRSVSEVKPREKPGASRRASRDLQRRRHDSFGRQRRLARIEIRQRSAD